MSENVNQNADRVETHAVASGEGMSREATKGYEEFEVGEHKVPWFLWVFFTLIVSWASVSWIKFFGY